MNEQSNNIDKIDKYFRQLHKYCLNYAKRHFYTSSNRSDIDYEEIAAEMNMLLWQDYRRRNKVGKVIEKAMKKGNKIANDILNKKMKNALRNKGLLNKNESLHPPVTATVIKDEDGKIVDYYVPPEPESEDETENFSYVREIMTAEQKKTWLRKIETLKTAGFSNEQVLEMLQPIGLALKAKAIKAFEIKEIQQKVGQETVAVQGVLF